MILTLTVNPAIDRSVSADRLVFEDRAYILDTSEGPGGRGINASLVIHSFGGKTLAIATAGGTAGECLMEFMLDKGFPVHWVPISNNIRTNLTITDQHGLTVKLNEMGPQVTAEECAQIAAAVRKRLPKVKWLMLCGSLAPGMPSDFYAGLVEDARNAGVQTLLDTDGDALREGLEANPTVVTPNQQEAERLLNRVLLTRSHYIDAVERIQQMGAQQVLLSLGSRGALGMMGERIWESVPPRIDAVCPIGAGDAMAAAFVWARHKNKEFWESLRWGVAAGTASARLPGVVFASLDETKQIYKKVEVRPIR